MRIHVESWRPEFGGTVSEEMTATRGPVDLDVEVPSSRWAPLPLPSDLIPAREVLFVDGVRRIDAIVYLTEGEDARRGICASFAAGVVRCGDRARIEGIAVRRALITPGVGMRFVTGAGTYEPVASVEDGLDRLIATLQEELGDLEIRVASSIPPGADLVVLDGPLTGRQHVRGAVGFVKTQHQSYLPSELNGVVARLRPGERTPLFLIGESWTRYAWYIRLPGLAGHPWAGIARLEVTRDRPPVEAATLADLSRVTLVRYASEAHKDPRAPQNLYPIGALERELKRRLGDAGVVERAVRVAASGVTGAEPKTAKL